MDARNERLAVSVTEAAALLGVSRPTVYTLLERGGGLPSFRCGRRRLIPVAALRAWIEAEAQAGGGAARV